MGGEYGLSWMIALVVMVGVLAFVCWPLFKPAMRKTGLASQRAEQPEVASLDNELYIQGLQSDREAALRALQDLDLERQLGNIGAADYTALRAAELERAIAIMRELDAQQPAASVDTPPDHPIMVSDPPGVPPQDEGASPVTGGLTGIPTGVHGAPPQSDGALPATGIHQPVQSPNHLSNHRDRVPARRESKAR